MFVCVISVIRIAERKKGSNVMATNRNCHSNNISLLYSYALLFIILLYFLYISIFYLLRLTYFYKETFKLSLTLSLTFWCSLQGCANPTK